MADSSLNNTDDGNPGYGYATHYLQLGFSVIPIRSMDYDSLSGKYCKAPALPSGGLKPFFDTRADTNQLYDWFVTQGHSNMAICTGRVSGIVVIDFDSQAAYDTIKDTLPHTVIAKSPRGIHCYFSYPLGHTIKCMVGYRKNIDIKADGGYIICPPSTTADGKYRYEWIYSPFDTPLAPLPDMFITQKAVHHISGNVSIDSGKKTLEQLLDDIRNAPSGTANDTLNRTAYCIGVKVAQGHLSHADAEHQILEAGKARGIPYAEIISTGINSGLASGIIKGEANTIDHMHNAHINNITNANAPVQYVPQQQDDDIVQYLNRGEVGDAELLAKECAGSYLFDHSAN
ncbi:MAG: bifunctional DNA primase/polymerase, partial [bacterium]|nr:bifunctional DNA primase/polymerase [bacterium]